MFVVFIYLQVFSGHDIFNFGPVIEEIDFGNSTDRFLPKHPVSSLTEKSFQMVPIITGITEYEVVRKAIG